MKRDFAETSPTPVHDPKKSRGGCEWPLGSPIFEAEGVSGKLGFLADCYPSQSRKTIIEVSDERRSGMGGGTEFIYLFANATNSRTRILVWLQVQDASPQ